MTYSTYTVVGHWNITQRIKDLENMFGKRKEKVELRVLIALIFKLPRLNNTKRYPREITLWHDKVYFRRFLFNLHFETESLS